MTDTVKRKEEATQHAGGRGGSVGKERFWESGGVWGGGVWGGVWGEGESVSV